MTDASIRASDDDREKVVTVLREAYSEGRLTADEFDERTSAAYAARTWGELRELTADLPVRPLFSLGELGVADDERGEQLLPPVPPASPGLMRPPPRSGWPFSRLLPVMFIWVVIAASAGASQLAVALAVVFVAVFGIRIISGRRW
jgi:hypothetical protein